MEWSFQAVNARQALSVRRVFVAFLHTLCTAESDCEGAEIIYGELVNNVILHTRGPIEIVVKAQSGNVVTIDVSDTGPSFSIPSALPPTNHTGGRGLCIVSRLSANLTVERREDGNKVSAVLPVRAKAGSFFCPRERPESGPDAVRPLFQVAYRKR